MSYFDHVKCHSCGARMDPEQLAPDRAGGPPRCPHCGAQLNLADLFGVKDAFVGLHDDEGNDHTLDDLVGGQLYDGRYADGRPPPPTPPAPRRRGPAAARPAARNGSPLRALTGPSGSSGSNAMVHQPRRDDDDAPAARSGVSALDLLREMKKKR